MQSPCQCFTNGAKGLRKGCDTCNQHQPKYSKVEWHRVLVRKEGKGTWTSVAASSGHHMKNRESNDSKTFRISLKIGHSISFT